MNINRGEENMTFLRGRSAGGDLIGSKRSRLEDQQRQSKPREMCFVKFGAPYQSMAGSEMDVVY